MLLMYMGMLLRYTGTLLRYISMLGIRVCAHSDFRTHAALPLHFLKERLCITVPEAGTLLCMGFSPQISMTHDDVMFIVHDDPRTGVMHSSV